MNDNAHQSCSKSICLLLYDRVDVDVVDDDGVFPFVVLMLMLTVKASGQSLNL